MKLIRPATEDKRAELERELAIETQRLKDSAEKAVGSLRIDLALKRVAEEHPTEAALLLMMGGLAFVDWRSRLR